MPNDYDKDNNVYDKAISCGKMNYGFWAKIGFADNNGDADDVDDNNQNRIESKSFFDS